MLYRPSFRHLNASQEAIRNGLPDTPAFFLPGKFDRLRPHVRQLPVLTSRFMLFFKSEPCLLRQADIRVILLQKMHSPPADSLHRLRFFRFVRGFNESFRQSVEPVPIGKEIGE